MEFTHKIGTSRRSSVLEVKDTQIRKKKIEVKD